MLIPSKKLRVKNLLAGAVASASLMLAAGAHANTAADATVRNTVTVNFADAAGVAQAAKTASVDVTVTLVKVAPTLTLTSSAAQTTSPNSNAIYTYTLRSNANGLVNYSVAQVSRTPSANVTSSTVEVQYPDAGNVTQTTDITSGVSIPLGATTVWLPTGTLSISNSTTTVVTVPSDTASNGSVNGIVAGDTVVIGGNTYTVSAVTDNGPTALTSTITLAAGGVAQTVSSGALISEIKTITVRVRGNVAANTATDQTVAEVINSSDGTNTSANSSTTTTIRVVNLAISKYVRNITTPAVGSGTAVTPVSGATYYPSGVTAKSGEVLEYLIQVANTGSSATSVVVADPVPAFTRFATGTLEVMNPLASSFSAVTDAAGDDAGQYTAASQTVNFYLGSPGTPVTSGGTLNSSETAYARFRVTVE